MISDFVSFKIRLQRHQRQALESAMTAIGVQRRQRAGMARVDRLQKGRGFRAANFAEKQAIGTKTKTRFEQVLNGHLCEALPAFRREQGQPVGLRRLQLARVLDRHDALAVGNLFEKRVEEGRLSRRRSARNNHRDVIFDGERQGSLHAFGGGVLQQRRQLRFDFRIMVEIGLGGTAHLHAFESAHARIVAQDRDWR